MNSELCFVIISWKSKGREIGCYNDRITLKFDSRLGNAAAEVRVKFKSDKIILTCNLAARDFTRFGGKTRVRLVNGGPGDDYMSHSNGSSLVQVMASHLFSGKPSPEPVING